jgi:hypothetical protein
VNICQSSNLDFTFIAALPKSASSFVWLIVSALQEPTGRANPHRMKGQGPNPFLPLRNDIFKIFPTGGVWKSHSPISMETSDVLSENQIKYVILLRHPADYLVSLYCHSLDDIFGSSWNRNSDWVFNQIYPVKKNAFDPLTPMDSAFKELIEGGSLMYAMGWMSDWLGFRDRSQSVVLRYEDLTHNLVGSVEKLSEFLFGYVPSNDIMDYLTEVWIKERDGKAEQSGSRYLRGWTGEPGIWRKYFNEDNALSYERIVGLFLQIHPHARHLLEIYQNVGRLEW